MKMVVQKKNGKEWMDVRTIEDSGYITMTLCRELISKYVEKSSWIKRVTEELIPDGKEITVTYDNGYRTIYTI